MCSINLNPPLPPLLTSISCSITICLIVCRSIFSLSHSLCFFLSPPLSLTLFPTLSFLLYSFSFSLVYLFIPPPLFTHSNRRGRLVFWLPTIAHVTDDDVTKTLKEIEAAVSIHWYYYLSSTLIDVVQRPKVTFLIRFSIVAKVFHLLDTEVQS